MQICVFTCSRSEYSLLFPIMKEIEKNESLSLQLAVTGTHLLPDFGMSKNIIKENGFNIDLEIQIPQYEDTLEFQTEVASSVLKELGENLKKLKADMLLVLGDRYEVLPAVYAAFLLNLPIAHIHGGDLSGNIDNSIRFAISRLSHVHFCATELSAKRLKKIGEEEWRIHVVGSPSIDNVKNVPKEENKIRKKFGIPLDKEFLLVVLHPETGGENKFQENCVKITLDAIKELKQETVFIYPNYDYGSSQITNEIKKLETVEWFHILKNVPHTDYINLLRSCFLLVGNSSSGIIEASAIKKPVINLGNRQDGRERAGNVIDLPFDKNIIVNTIKKLREDKNSYFKYTNTKNIYGEGNSAQKIVKVLENIKINQKLLKKHIIL